MQTRIEQSITFGRDGNAEPYQLGGWSEPERGFAWSVGHECGLLFPRPEAPWGCFVEIVGAAFAVPPKLHGQRLLLRANGRIVGRVLLSGLCVAAFYVRPLDPLDSSLVISIEQLDATRPGDVSGSADSRELAFAFQRVRILSLLESCEPWPKSVSFATVLNSNGDTEFTEAIARIAGVPVSDLTKKFESLGDNCELGFVQRRCGTEPLGLFRFSTARAIPVLHGIDDEFACVSENIQPQLEERSDGPSEWMIHQQTYEMRYHTFVHEGEASAEEMRAREATKLGFLRRKLLEDIDGANKIFVLKRHSPPMGYAETLPIYLALRRRHADNRLLWLSLSDDSHPVGLVHELLPGLMQGYVDRLWPPHDPSLHSWLAVLANAWRLSQSEATI
jgi:hypothetical protein